MVDFPTFLRVAILPAKLIFETNKDSKEGKLFKGIEADLLQTLSEGLNFNFELVVPNDNRWGSIDEFGNWTGIIGMLKANDADIGLSYLDITESRMEAVDFSVPYDVADKTFATMRPRPYPSFAAFTYPFDLYAWISILTAYIVICFVFILLSSKESSWSKIVIGIFGTLCRQPFIVKETVYSWKTVFALWCVFVTVITSSYGAVLYSYLAIPLTRKGITTVSELAAAVHGGTYRCKITEGTHDLQILLDSKQEQLQALGETVLENNWFYDTLNLSLATHIDSQTAIMANRALLSRGEFLHEFVSLDSFGVWNVGIAFRKTFCCKDRLNTIILRILSSGIYQKFRKDEFAKSSEVDVSHVEQYNLQNLSLDDIYGVFIPLIFGYLLSIAVFICELIYFYGTGNIKKNLMD